jgi:Whirly transcription factor
MQGVSLLRKSRNSATLGATRFQAGSFSSQAPAYAAPASSQSAHAEAPVFGAETWLGCGYEVYKSRAAVQFKPIVASFQNNGPGTHLLDRKGVMLMEFANAAGARTYDWQDKISFALSVTEMAELFLVDGTLQKGVSLYHDPNMQSSSQGQVRQLSQSAP